jgi:hypothetical protein
MDPQPIVITHKEPDVKVATRDDLTTSTNSLQTQIQGIGATIGQLANKMSLVEGDLLKIQNSLEIKASATAIAELQTDVRASIKAITDVKLQFDAEINAITDIKAQLNAQANLFAQLEAKLQGQVGLSNKIDELKNEVSSGRDSVVTTIQFTDNVMKTIIYGNLFYAGIIIVIVVSICVVIIVLMSNSRKRAEDRYKMERDHRMTFNVQRGGTQ